MLLYPSINEIRTKADSRFTLVILAAKRARDLVERKPKLADGEPITPNDVPISVAAEEIVEDLITYKHAVDLI